MKHKKRGVINIARKNKTLRRKEIVYSAEEWEQIEKQAADCHLKTATFIRAMSLSGKVNVIDLKEIAPLLNGMRTISRNINQIAKKANETCSIFADDAEKLKGDMSELYVNQMAEKYTGRLPRMADFCVYGAAFIKAVGLSDEEFVVDYTRSINESVSECNETDPFNMIIKSFLSSVEGCRWRGGAQDLLALLQLYAKNNRMKLDEHLSASSLSRKLGQNQAALKSIGIVFNRDKNGTERVIELLLSSETVCSPANTRSPEFKGRKIVPKKEILKSEIEDDQEEW